jgi:hypothetical protein
MKGKPEMPAFNVSLHGAPAAVQDGYPDGLITTAVSP